MGGVGAKEQQVGRRAGIYNPKSRTVEWEGPQTLIIM